MTALSPVVKLCCKLVFNNTGQILLELQAGTMGNTRRTKPSQPPPTFSGQAQVFLKLDSDRLLLQTVLCTSVCLSQLATDEHQPVYTNFIVSLTRHQYSQTVSRRSNLSFSTLLVTSKWVINFGCDVCSSVRLLGARMFRCAVLVSTNPTDSFVCKRFPQSQHETSFKKRSNQHAIEMNGTPSLALSSFEVSPHDPIEHKLWCTEVEVNNSRSLEILQIRKECRSQRLHALSSNSIKISYRIFVHLCLLFITSQAL